MQHRTCVGNTHFTPRQCLASQTLLGEIGVLTFQPSLVGCVLCCLRQCSPVCSRNSTHRHSCSLLCQFYPGLPLVHSLLAARASVLFECLHESVGVPRTGLLKKFANQRHDKWSLALWRLQLGHPKGAQTRDSKKPGFDIRTNGADCTIMLSPHGSSLYSSFRRRIGARIVSLSITSSSCRCSDRFCIARFVVASVHR